MLAWEEDMHVPKHILIPEQDWRLYTVFLGVELYTANSNAFSLLNRTGMENDASEWTDPS